jgi:competence protein ComEC
VKAPALVRLAPTAPAAAACVGLAAANWVRPGTVVAAALASIAATGWALGGQARATGVAALCLVTGLWWGGLRADALEQSVLAARIEASARAVVVVTGPPRRTRFSVRLAAEVRRFDGRDLRERTLLELPPGRSPPLGALLELRVRVRAPRPPEDGFDERAWLARRGVHVVLRGSDDWRIVGRRGGLAGFADRLHRRLDRTIARGLDGDRRGIVAGVVLGEDEGLSPALRSQFRASGLYHLLAVSGQNVLFIGIGLAGLAWLLAVPRLLLELGVLGAIGLYVLAVGWQPSVVRAAVAGALASLAWLAARPRDRWHALVLGAVALLAWMPSTLLEPGFQLSFSAVAAIFLVVPRLKTWLEGYPVPGFLREVIAVSTACGLVTAPIAWLQFGSVPLYTVPANALAWPVAAPLLIAGLLAAIVQPVLPSAALALAWANGWLAAYLAWVARTIAALPAAQLGSGRSAAIAVTALVAIVVISRVPAARRLALLGAAAAVAAFAFGFAGGGHAPRLLPPTDFRVVFLDVGQGDSALLQTAAGNVLVDEGPPEAHVGRQLRELGVRRLAALVLTHPERDHVGGAVEVLKTIEVDRVLEGGQRVRRPDGDAAIAEARRAGVPVTVVEAGEILRLGRLRLRVLWPDGAGAASANPNDRAIVLLASFGETDVFLPADAESNVTGRLALSAVEVLKVAHHGSEDTGLPDELGALRPRIAVVSVGAGNDYGHPRAETLAALAAVPGIRVFRTDRDGRVTIESDGRSMWAESER